MLSGKRSCAGSSLSISMKLTGRQLKIFKSNGGIEHYFNDTHWFSIDKEDEGYVVDVRKLREKSAVCIKGTSLLVGRPVIEQETDTVFEAYVLYHKAIKKYESKRNN